MTQFTAWLAVILRREEKTMAHATSNTISVQDREKTFAFLEQHIIGVLAAVDPNGDPHATVIYYSIDEDFNVSFITKRGTKKHDVLQHNNRAVLVVYEPASQSVSQVTGTVDEVTDSTRANEIFRGALRGALRTSESGVPPISKLHAGEYVAYRLRPRQITYATFAQSSVGEYKQIFTTIDFDD